MIVRKDSNNMKASKVMQRRVKNTANITIHWSTETVDILGDKKVEAVQLRNNSTGEESIIHVNAFFVAIGHQPNSNVFKSCLEMDETGYIITQPGSSRTNIAGVFAAVDVQDKIYRQAVTASGSGCMAALDAERYLSMQSIHNVVEV
jgi:thioredoxin reductase (NADPH)